MALSDILERIEGDAIEAIRALQLEADERRQAISAKAALDHKALRLELEASLAQTRQRLQEKLLTHARQSASTDILTRKRALMDEFYGAVRGAALDMSLDAWTAVLERVLRRQENNLASEAEVLTLNVPKGQVAAFKGSLRVLPQATWRVVEDEALRAGFKVEGSTMVIEVTPESIAQIVAQEGEQVWASKLFN